MTEVFYYKAKFIFIILKDSDYSGEVTFGRLSYFCKLQSLFKAQVLSYILEGNIHSDWSWEVLLVLRLVFQKSPIRTAIEKQWLLCS